MPRQSLAMSSARLFALRDKSTVPVRVVELLERRSSVAVSLASMAFSSAVSAHPLNHGSVEKDVQVHLLVHRMRAGFGDVTWGVSVRAPSALAREIASSTKPSVQRRCTSHEQDACTKAVSSTNPWQMLHIIRPPWQSRVALVGDPPPPLLTGIAIGHRLCHNSFAFLLECSSVRLFNCYGRSARRATLGGRRFDAEGGVARRVE